jgi:hypothetical protein
MGVAPTGRRSVTLARQRCIAQGQLHTLPLVCTVSTGPALGAGAACASLGVICAVRGAD